jgi:hypothetical protein
MQYARLNSRSTVLTSAGWRKADCQTEVFGVDRHGKVVPQRVSISHLREPTRAVFLASKDSFGYFSAETRLLDSTGAARTISSLVENNQISDVRFETVASLAGIVASDDSGLQLWASFSDFAATTNSEQTILRCRWPNKKLTDNAPPFLSVRRFGQHYYSVLNKPAFLRAFREDWSFTADILASKWLLTSEGTLQFHRDQFLFALWVLSARKQRNQGAALRFETRQHTTCIFMALTENQTLSGGTGASCFYMPTEEEPFELRWEDRSWNPISSGFLLAST